MKLQLLQILECPFCGGGFEVQKSPRAKLHEDEVSSAILRCACCAYPVVDGIPFLMTGKVADAAMDLLGAGRPADALKLLLELGETDHPEKFSTFREALAKLSKDSEGDYLLYRFSDPTFVCSHTLLQAVVTPDDVALDIGGGAGHLARSVRQTARHVVIADVAYWKLWLAKKFVAPDCESVCCNARNPLPFARKSFSLTYCSDAFHYVWPRRLLADEMMRATRGSLVSKVGAEGVYTAGVLPCEAWPNGLGLALKIEDGDDHRARPTVVIESLHQLSVLTDEAREALSKYAFFPICNRRGEIVGEVHAAFSLNVVGRE